MKIIVQGAAQKRKEAVQKILFTCRGCGCVWEMQPDDEELEEDVFYGIGPLGTVVEKLHWSRCPNCWQTNNNPHYVFK